MQISQLTYWFLFFAFFISFSVINIPSAQWGLQVSWAIGVIILSTSPLSLSKRIPLYINYNFRLISTFFLIIIINSILSWYLQIRGVISFINIERDELIDRSIPHCIYLLFEYLLYLYLIFFLKDRRKQRKAIYWFIVYPFYIITLYGIYQWLSTFDLVPYTDIFNNNSSTGFTYLRFKGSHRCCSVFPEPSEYAYYLGFILPFILAPFYNKRTYSAPIFFKSRKTAIILYLIAFFTSGSMSLFAVTPIILILILKKFIKISLSKYIFMIILGIILLSCIIALEGDRISEMLSGDDGSTLTRTRAFEETISLFLGSPLIGGGFGSVRGLDLLSFLLGTTGLIGTILFIYVLVKLRTATYANEIFKMGLICMIIVALMSNPIIDHTFFWPILAFNTVTLHFDS